MNKLEGIKGDEIWKELQDSLMRSGKED